MMWDPRIIKGVNLESIEQRLYKIQSRNYNTFVKIANFCENFVKLLCSTKIPIDHYSTQEFLP